jgi:small neutral amino acid transporter SnatA (MarC family)
VPAGRAYLLNPVGIVGLMTISAEAKSLSVFAVEFGILVFVLVIDVAVFRLANRVSEQLDEGRMLVTGRSSGPSSPRSPCSWSSTAWSR